MFPLSFCFHWVTHCLSPDVLFEEDASVMPLMSAAKIWSTLEDTVADETVFKNITTLLVVQVILLSDIFFFSYYSQVNILL